MDSSAMEDGNNTLFLLQRLQELKIWQKEQEIKLNEEKKGVHFEDLEDPDRNSPHFSCSSASSSSSSEDEDDTTIDQELPYVREPFEERPIGVHKTFEELLEEELLKEPSPKGSTPKQGTSLQPFLRKGAGLGRFSPMKMGDSPTKQQIQEDECNLSLHESVEIIRPPHEVSRLNLTTVSLHEETQEDEEEEELTEVCDSVELSFMQKIKTLQKKEQEELAAFEILEEAAVDTSFCSNSSVVRKLIQSAASKNSVTSTPKRKGSESRSTYTLSSNNAQDSLTEEDSESTIRNKSEEHPEESKSFLSETPNIYSFIGSHIPTQQRSKKSSLVGRGSAKSEGMDPDQGSDKFNLKISDLEKEITKYKNENTRLHKLRTSVMTDKRKLALDIQRFEKSKDEEKKKLEEERRRIKRDERLLEKARKEVYANQSNASSKEVQFIQNKMKILKGDFNKNESRWNNTYKKLQDRIKTLEKENQLLHEENHKLKLRRTSSKVFKDFKSTVDCKDDEYWEPDEDGSHSSSPPPVKAPESLSLEKVDSVIEKGFLKQPQCGDVNSNPKNPSFKLNTPINNPEEKADSEIIPFTYSGVESLESDITLVDNSFASRTTTSESATLIDVKYNTLKGTTEKTYSDGTVEVSYANGNRKEVRDGVTKVFYYNGDVKINETSERIVKYYYSKTKTWHLSYPDKEVFKFESGQQEKKYKDGTHEIIFTDGSVKKVLPDGSELIILPDRTRVNVTVEGHKILSFPNGQVETHMPEYKKRQYLDGTVKILYNDGKQETRYANGRVRIKNKEGELIFDSNEDGPQ